MTVTLVTVPGVPIVSTGTYQLASGETTFSTEDLADAVRAASDATVPAARLKLGHTDPRFDEAIAAGDLDGEPAFGTVQNLRLSDDGQTVLGDYCDVPEWLAEMLPSSYPGRSIEGGFGYTAPSGRSYRLVIARVALLGITWPGVTSLADLREVLEQNGEVQDTGQIEAGADSFVIARIARPGDGQEPRRSDVLAGMDIGNVRMQFCADLDSGEVPQVPDDQPQADDVGAQMWWWPRSVRVEDDGSLCLIVDDDGGRLIRIPFTVNQGDLIYGSPQLVIETYVPVTLDPDDGAVTARGPRTLVSWPIRAASRPSTTTEVTTMDVDAAVLRKRLGLAEDADDAAITAALTTEPPQDPPAADPSPAPSIPEGMTLVDETTLTTLRNGAQQAEAIAARLAREDRDKIINAAIREGKFAPSRKEAYEKLWAADEEGARTTIASLAPGLVPVGRHEVGGSGDGDTQPESVEAEHAAFMASHFPNETARLANRDRGRVRVRTEA
jgi:hypothetical protein